MGPGVTGVDLKLAMAEVQEAEAEAVMVAEVVKVAEAVEVEDVDLE